MAAHTTHKSSCADHITSRGIARSNSCHDVSQSGSSISIISSRQSSCTLASPWQSGYPEIYPSSPSVYSLTSAATSDCESPPETPARNRSIFNLARIPDPIPESAFNDESDMEGLFTLGHQHDPKELDYSGRSTTVRLSLKRWRRKVIESKHRSGGDEPSPGTSTDTKLTPDDSSQMQNHILGDGTCSRPIPHGPVGSNSHANSHDIGSVPPGVSHSPIIEFVALNPTTPTQEAIGCSTGNITIPPRPLKRARRPPPLDIKSISSYDMFVSQARSYDTNEIKYKKTVTSGLGLGLPSVPGGRKPTRTQDGTDTHSPDLVGPIRANYRPCLQEWRSSSLPIPEASPGPVSVPPSLPFPLAPRLRPIDPVDPLNPILSPLELPSPPIYNANSSKAKSAPACQLYFDGISRSPSVRTNRPLSAKGPTPTPTPTATATPSQPSTHSQLVVPPAYRRASSYLKEAIASLPGSGLHSPIPPSLVGTPYLESVSSPFSPHFRARRNNLRAASEGPGRHVSVDVDAVDEHWIDVKVPSPEVERPLSGLSSLTARQWAILGERVGKGPSGRRRKKSPRKEAKGGCNPYFADAEPTHSALFTVVKSA